MLAGIVGIYIFIDVFGKAILSILPRDYFIGIIKSIVTPYKIVIIPLKDLYKGTCRQGAIRRERGTR